MKKTMTVAAVVAAISVMPVALAHKGATGIVKERMDAMGELKKSVKTLAEMMQGKTDYDADVVRQEAARIKIHSGEAMTKLFPEGVHQKASEARPEIWKQWEDFQTLADRLGTFAEALGAAADNGLMKDGTMPHGGGGMSNMMGTGNQGMMSGQGTMGQGNMGQHMMGGGMMMGGQMPDPEMLAEMPVDGVFNMLSQTCSACHTRFRQEKH